jgi:hypothetical protein
MTKQNFKTTSPQTLDEKLHDFLDEDYNKVYYLIKNEYGDDRGRKLKHSNELCKEAKRMSLFKYYDVDEKDMKANHRTSINKLVIDADNGVYKSITRLKGLIDTLGLEYWIIRGTDKPNKHPDSGSLIIKFQRERVNKEKFQTLVKCLNIHSGGDIMNIGYMFKNPQWKGVKGFEHINCGGTELISFDELYEGTLNFYGTTAEEINEQHKELSQKEFDQKVLVELNKEIPDPQLIRSWYYRSSKTPELTQKVEQYLNNSERVKRHKMSKKQYAKYLIIWDVFFGQNKKNNSPKSLKEQFAITDKEVNYWDIKVKEDPLFNPFNPLIFSIKQIQSYGFNSQEVEHILCVQKIMLEKGQKTKKENRDAKRKRIIELNQKVFEQKITEEELIELYKLTKHKNYEKGNFTIKGKSKPIEQTLLLVKLPFSYKNKLYQKEYIDENNNILTKEYIVEYYLGGVEKKQFRKQITKFGIRQYSRNWDENRNLIKKQQNRESRENLKKVRKELKQKKAVDTKLKEENEMINKMREAEYIDKGWGYYDDAGNFNLTEEYKFQRLKEQVKEWVKTTLENINREREYKRINATFDLEEMKEAQRLEAARMVEAERNDVFSSPFVTPLYTTPKK